MPIYEYRCRGCEDEFEQLVLGSERPVCPRCRSRSLEKLTSSFAALGVGRSAPEPVPANGCGRCGDPRGPGACSS